ncbi:uncharacterized protein LOC133328972, partial [Musca vetustissima]|uniref:uncharacterized protein LOC133328972 n=1 Tax=Musca vetustissima TaxID=27455 RepID=UPI002AB66C27
MSISALLALLLLYNLTQSDAAAEFCGQNMHEATFYNDSITLRALVIWFPAAVGTQNKLNLCSLSTGQTLQRTCYRNGSGTMWDNPPDPNMSMVYCNYIQNHCQSETFEHKYIMKNNILRTNINQWPAGQVGGVVQSQEPCLQRNGSLLTRQCIYTEQDHAANWMPKNLTNITCLHDIENSIVTYDLNELNNEVQSHNGTLTSEYALNATTSLKNILEKSTINRIPADLQISTNILQNVIGQNKSKQPELLPNVMKIANNLMNSSQSVITVAKKYGTTKTLIQTVEEYLDDITATTVPTSNCTQIPNGVLIKSEGLLTVFYINAVCSNISGVVIYNRNVQPTRKMSYDIKSNSYYRCLYMNQSLDDLLQESQIEVAVHLPENLWKSNENLTTVKISLYRRNELFTGHTLQPNSLVTKVTVPDYK